MGSVVRRERLRPVIEISIGAILLTAANVILNEVRIDLPAARMLTLMGAAVVLGVAAAVVLSRRIGVKRGILASTGPVFVLFLQKVFTNLTLHARGWKLGPLFGAGAFGTLLVAIFYGFAGREDSVGVDRVVSDRTEVWGALLLETKLAMRSGNASRRGVATRAHRDRALTIIREASRSDCFRAARDLADALRAEAGAPLMPLWVETQLVDVESMRHNGLLRYVLAANLIEASTRFGFEPVMSDAVAHRRTVDRLVGGGPALCVIEVESGCAAARRREIIDQIRRAVPAVRLIVVELSRGSGPHAAHTPRGLDTSDKRFECPFTEAMSRLVHELALSSDVIRRLPAYNGFAINLS